MRDYLNFTSGKLSKPSGNATSDGKNLVEQCLEELSDYSFEKFPPKLLILLLSKSFLDPKENQKYAIQLINAIYQRFDEEFDKKKKERIIGEELKLIGSSVAGVFFNKKIHSDGALLICLSSKLIDVSVEYGKDAREKPKEAITILLKKLGIKNKIDSNNNLGTSSNELLIDPNPLANKVILTFMPGCKQNSDPQKFYPAPQLHNFLYEGVRSRIMITGGVSSVDDITRNKDGYQICGKTILKDSVVAAIITTGVPIGIGLNDALKGDNEILSVELANEKERLINKFYESDDSPSKVLEDYSKLGNLMLAKLTADDERMLDLPLKANKEGSIELLKQTKKGDHFELLKPQKDVSEALTKGIKQSKERVVFIQNPIASLLLFCKSYLRFHREGLLNIENSISSIEKSSGFPCIGGFFDGEMGVDNKSRSRMTNGSISYITFGDEMRERTPLYRSISAFTELGHELVEDEKTPDSFDNVIETALKIIDDSGFPGAMISLIQSNLERDKNGNNETIIAKKATPNSRFSDIVEDTKRSLDGNDVLAIVVKTNRPKFVSNSRIDEDCNEKATEKSGVISQYILPLRRVDNSVFGILQVDLGDLSFLTQEDFEKTEKARVLKFLGQTLGTEINRMANASEKITILKIDAVLKEAMKETRFLDGIQKFVESLQGIFSVEWGHLWLTEIDEPSDTTEPKLFLEAGFGNFFDYINKKGEKREAPKNTPISLAFGMDGSQIINDTSADQKWKDYLKDLGNFGNDKKLRKIAREVKSNAAISFTGEDDKLLGAISFSSHKEWFFLHFHQKMMDVLAERLRFLVEHLKTKIHHTFLLKANSKITDKNLDNTKPILNDILRNFCIALDAECGSLYIWDPDRKKYILRAESEWKDKRWVDAAFHERNVGWLHLTGKGDVPTYHPNIYELYIKNEYEYPNGRYFQYIFDKPLSDEFTVEGIGLPLQIGNQPEDRIGVMTFYREIKKGNPSGFTTKDIELLKESINNVVGLVSAVIKRRNRIRERGENDRRQTVIQSIDSDEKKVPFEDQVCCEILRTYKASEVAFYRVDSFREHRKHSWVAGFHEKDSEEIKSTGDNSSNYNPNIMESLSTCFEDVCFNQIQMSDKDLSNPRLLKIEGFINEAYIPILSTKKFLGIIVIRWEPNPDDTFFSELRLDKHLCRALGLTIGSRYRKEQLKQINNLQTQAIRATAAFAANNSHTLSHNVRDIRSELYRMKKGEGNIDEAISFTRVAMDNCIGAVKVGKRIMYPSRRNFSLQKIIDKVFRKDQDSLNKKFADLGLVIPAVDKECVVNVDIFHTMEALFNLFDNAIDSINRKTEKGALHSSPNISFDINFLDKSREIKLIISDNGEGMTEEQKSKAKQGFWKRKDSNGEDRAAFGVLLSDVLLTAQGGSLDYESELGFGTKTIVILPAAKME